LPHYHPNGATNDHLPWEAHGGRAAYALDALYVVFWAAAGTHYQNDTCIYRPYIQVQKVRPYIRALYTGRIYG